MCQSQLMSSFTRPRHDRTMVLSWGSMPAEANDTRFGVRSPKLLKRFDLPGGGLSAIMS